LNDNGLGGIPPKAIGLCILAAMRPSRFERTRTCCNRAATGQGRPRHGWARCTCLVGWDFAPQTPIEAFNYGNLHGPSQRDVLQGPFCSGDQRNMVGELSFAPLSPVVVCGLPRKLVRAVSSRPPL